MRIFVEGPEGAGKTTVSLLTLQQLSHIDKKFCLYCDVRDIFLKKLKYFLIKIGRKTLYIYPHNRYEYDVDEVLFIRLFNLILFLDLMLNLVLCSLLRIISFGINLIVKGSPGITIARYLNFRLFYCQFKKYKLKIWSINKYLLSFIVRLMFREKVIIVTSPIDKLHKRWLKRGSIPEPIWWIIAQSYYLKILLNYNNSILHIDTDKSDMISLYIIVRNFTWYMYITDINPIFDLIERKMITRIRKLFREKIGVLDINHIYGKIYIGSFPANRKLISSLFSSHNCLIIDLRAMDEKREAQYSFPNYISFPTIDGTLPEINHLSKLLSIILIKSKKIDKLVLLCRLGRSRSASLAVALLMIMYNLSLKESYELVKKRRKFIRITPSQARTILELVKLKSGDN